jgi:hypothetical protein
VGHETTSSPNRRLVPLEASAPEDGPRMPPPSPLETSRGTVVLVAPQGSSGRWEGAEPRAVDVIEEFPCVDVTEGVPVLGHQTAALL